MKKLLVALLFVIGFAGGVFADDTVLFWGFDTNGNYEGWNDVGNKLNDSVANGVLSYSHAYSSAAADPQFKQTAGVGVLDLSRDFTLEVKVRRTSGAAATFFAFMNSNPAFAAKVMANNNDWQTITLNYAGGKNSGTVSALRLDPVIGGSSATDGAWEIDYIKITQVR